MKAVEAAMSGHWIVTKYHENAVMGKVQDGWEPFAATRSFIGPTWIWLRKYIEEDVSLHDSQSTNRR